MHGPFSGQFLRVDLTRGTIQIEEIRDLIYRTYPGGSALAAYLLVREVKPRIDPLGPDNILVFATRLTTGSPLSGTIWFSVGAKSPLTCGYGEGEAGGRWGPELKFAGFDGIIVTCRSPDPLFLWIADGKAELREASHLWTRVASEVQDILKDQTDGRARVLQCGIVVEKGSWLANIVNELKHFNGRWGLGAVMGSKRLKAIVARGGGKVEPKDREGLSRCVRCFREHYDRNADVLYKFGTARNLMNMDRDGILATCNFLEGSFENAKEVSGQHLTETILTERGTCYVCAVSCKREVEAPELGISSKYGGPEYETIGASGPLCGIGDLKVIAKFHQVCGEYVMATISAGVTIAFAMECSQNGILTTQTPAAGLVHGGMKPFAHSFSVFASLKACEQIRADLFYNRLNVRVVGTHSGLSTGPAGSTHYSVEGIGVVRSMPTSTIVVPAGAPSTRAAVRRLAAHDGPAYLRLDCNPLPVLYAGEVPFEIGRANVLRQGCDVLLFATGSDTALAAEAARTLAARSIEVTVVHVHRIKPLDGALVAECGRRFRHAFTIEEHNIFGQSGGAIAEVLAQEGNRCSLTRIGIPDTYLQGGLLEAVRARAGLSPARLVSRVLGRLDARPPAL